MSTNTTLPDLPPGYDLTTAQTCSFLVNVAVDMCKAWIADGKPDPSAFSWTPEDRCPITKGEYNVSDFDFSQVIWSTFTLYSLKNISLSVTEPFGVVATNKKDGRVYLVFRGSQTEADFIMDAQTRLVPYDAPTGAAPSTDMEVEKGFYAVYNGMVESLKSQLPVPGQLTITGHSLGSALATLAAPLAMALGQDLNTQYNQASPKVGNQAFADYIDESLNITTFRLVNTKDWVPKTPFNRDYVHVGTEVDFTADYGSEENNHNPCCSYSYAIFHPDDPVNPDFDTCTGSDQ